MLQGKRILVIEDEFLIALDIASTLKQAGAQQVQLAASVEAALGLLELDGWDAAVSDANLQGEGIDAIVETLLAKRIPFLILTGYGRAALPRSALGAPVMMKPFSPPALTAALVEVCGSSVCGSSD